MDLKRKLLSLRSAGPGSRAAEAVTTSASALASNDQERSARIAELRGRIHTLMARDSRSHTVRQRPSTDALPFVCEDSADGPVHWRTRSYDSAQRHGLVPVHAALSASAEAVATLAIDGELRSFDPSRALFLDTETTGLSGGTGMFAFLVGLGVFAGPRFRVDQLFLAEPCNERAMLMNLSARIESASALVTFNGKAFDMPLLRSRFVMARLPPPKEPPHLDLVHVARRIYGVRVDGCKLTTLERDVLGFAREADVPSGEIPMRYIDYLRSGNANPLLAVVDHNLWDVIAMAALLGELASRISGGESAGRFEPADMTGMARTAFRAGAHTLAITLAHDAAHEGVRQNQTDVATRANSLTAEIYSRQKNHAAVERALLNALALMPADPEIHLSLTKLYEHRLRDPIRALDHARHASPAEEAPANLRRIQRLERRIERQGVRASKTSP